MTKRELPEPILMNTEQAAAYLGIQSYRTLEAWRYARNGVVGPPWVQVSGRSVRYRKADLDAWIEERVQRAQRGA